MPPRAPNVKLAALLDATSWSAADLARAVNALGEAQGLLLRYDRTAVAHWLKGSRPRRPVPDLVGQAFSHRAGRLISAEDTGLAHPGRLSRADMPLPGTGQEEGGGLPRLVALCSQDADPSQRAALASITYSLVPHSRPIWRPDPPRPDQDREPYVSAEEQFLSTVVELFAGLARAHGGAYIRSALAAYLADNAARPAVDGAPLHVLDQCALLTHLLASMTADTGLHGLAHQYYVLALEVAREAGNRASYAITLRAMSVQALRLGHIHQAHSLADSAVECAERHDPAVLAFALAQRGHTHAARRDGKGATADLVGSAEAHRRADGHGGAFAVYPEAGIAYRRARTLQVLQRPGEAVLAFHSSILQRDPGQHRPYALTQARLAEVLLEDGQLEDACAHWHIFLDHYPYVVGSNEAGRALARMLQHARSYPRQRQAVELLERGRASSARLPRY
ncbi:MULTISPECIES: hypothetical protein [unclassified Streptomyces]|uniref:hypothetical protein n=1 Tax=Streptomyces sp. NPDC127532 TaxID=3345399 RepID=UPI0036289F2E